VGTPGKQLPLARLSYAEAQPMQENYRLVETQLAGARCVEQGMTTGLERKAAEGGN